MLLGKLQSQATVSEGLAQGPYLPAAFPIRNLLHVIRLRL